MKQGDKIIEIRKAFEDFANTHSKGEDYTYTTRYINDEVQKKLSFKLNMAVSDFAEPECSKPRTYGNKELFKRIHRGKYYILP